jgi:hypothetical protein
MSDAQLDQAALADGLGQSYPVQPLTTALAVVVITWIQVVATPCRPDDRSHPK